MDKFEFDMRELMGDTSITARIHFKRTFWCNVGLAIIRVGAWVTGAQFAAEDVDELTTESEEEIELAAGQFYRITAMPIEEHKSF